jgi:hypothetical protein
MATKVTMSATATTLTPRLAKGVKMPSMDQASQAGLRRGSSTTALTDCENTYAMDAMDEDCMTEKLLQP